MLCKHCCIVMLAKKRDECCVCWVSAVSEVMVRFLEGEDIKILGGGKFNCTGGGVVTFLVSGSRTKGSGGRGRRVGRVGSRRGGLSLKMNGR